MLMIVKIIVPIVINKIVIMMTMLSMITIMIMMTIKCPLERVCSSLMASQLDTSCDDHLDHRSYNHHYNDGDDEDDKPPEKSIV